MNSKASIVLLAGCMSLLISCAKSSDDKPVPEFTSDYERPIGQPRFSFQEENQDMKLASLSTSEVSETMGCTQKSTADRTDKKKFSVSYSTIYRSLNNEQNTLLSDKVEYSTETREEVYSLTTSMFDYVIAGRSVLSNGGIAYVDSCTASSGCDPEKRKFLVGSPSYLIATKAMEARITEELKLEKNTTECSIKSVTEETQQIQPGQIRVGENTFKAVQLTIKKAGKIYCVAGSYRENFYLGEGVEITKSIYLKDQLVLGAKMSKGSLSSQTLGCPRSVAFISNEIQFEGRSIRGSSTEMVDYQFKGETLPLEEWNKKQAAIKQRIAEMKDDVIAAKAYQDRSQMAVGQAEGDLKTSESKLADLKVLLNEAVAGKKPEEADLRVRVKDADSAVESGRARLDSAKGILVKAQLQLKAEEEELATYIKANGTGEN